MDSENTVISPGDLVALIDHAESGDAMACITLGRLYYEGVCVPRDPRRAEAMYYSAELTGQTDALRILGSMYLNGDCAPPEGGDRRPPVQEGGAEGRPPRAVLHRSDVPRGHRGGDLPVQG